MKPVDNSADWIRIRRDSETGIESVHAHFHGHAYDAHDHDEMLVGVTQQGIQRFTCHGSVHTSTRVRCILIEPGAVHDGHAPEQNGFTYAMLYLPQAWVNSMTQRLGLGDASSLQGAFRNTLADDAMLSTMTMHAWQSIHFAEGCLARDESLDGLVSLLSRHLYRRSSPLKQDTLSEMARVREYLHAMMPANIGLDELAAHSGIDRFRLTRQFKRAFGQSPHAYLIRLRLRVARALLASGKTAAEVASEVGFADQSHMGLWFRRAYRLTPADYQRQCTNLTD